MFLIFDEEFSSKSYVFQTVKQLINHRVIKVRSIPVDKRSFCAKRALLAGVKGADFPGRMAKKSWLILTPGGISS
jgi:hypothetical protein